MDQSDIFESPKIDVAQFYDAGSEGIVQFVDKRADDRHAPAKAGEITLIGRPDSRAIREAIARDIRGGQGILEFEKAGADVTAVYRGGTRVAQIVKRGPKNYSVQSGKTKIDAGSIKQAKEIAATL